MTVAVLTNRLVVSVIAGFATVKGLTIALVATAFTSDFVGALVIAIVSGTLGVFGMVLAAWISSRNYHQQIHPELKDMKRKIGADKREGDNGG